MKTMFSFINSYSTFVVIIACYLLILLITIVGYHYSSTAILEPIYLLPLVVLSWYAKRISVVVVAICIIALALLIQSLIVEGAALSLTIIFYISVRLIIYILISILIMNFKSAHKQESIFANTDSLTNLLNSRSFHIDLANEILRSVRYQHVFSLAYIDIDNFKRINDSIGHSKGDELLFSVAKCLVLNLRKTDIIARLGGDEFAVIFPETGQEEVKNAFAKASKNLKKQMLNKGWNVSFSVGIVTFETLPTDIKEAVNIADKLMYTVKNNKKDDVAFQLWQGAM